MRPRAPRMTQPDIRPLKAPALKPKGSSLIPFFLEEHAPRKPLGAVRGKWVSTGEVCRVVSLTAGFDRKTTLQDGLPSPVPHFGR